MPGNEADSSCFAAVKRVTGDQWLVVSEDVLRVECYGKEVSECLSEEKKGFGLRDTPYAQ